MSERAAGHGTPDGGKAQSSNATEEAEVAEVAEVADVPSSTKPEPPPRDPVLSVVVCTHNRAEDLERALESVTRQLAGPNGKGSGPGSRDPEVEILVVDNASTDGTEQVVGAFSGRVRYVFEPALGLCHARNRGWREARGQYIAYLDDDAVADPGWLPAVVEAFERTPRPGVVGGRVEPIWEGERPSWLSDELALGLTIVDWSKEPCDLPDIRKQWLVGANMALPRAVLERVGGFHPGLDRAGDRMLSSGDVFLQKKVIELGYSCFYHPRMAVRHRVPRSRLEKRWFRRRYFWQGVSDATMELIEEAPSPPRRALNAGRRLLRMLASPGRSASLLVPTSSPSRFTKKCMALIELGHIAGLLGAAKR